MNRNLMAEIKPYKRCKLMVLSPGILKIKKITLIIKQVFFQSYLGLHDFIFWSNIGRDLVKGMQEMQRRLITVSSSLNKIYNGEVSIHIFKTT